MGSKISLSHSSILLITFSNQSSYIMSQKGFLSENELSEQIHKYFDLKLDKDALVKPTKDVVREIYKRFLDQIVVNWMLPRYPGQEATPHSRMLYWMRTITQRFNTGYEFSLTDLTAPTKKRTTAFLNVILYIRAVYDECLEIYQQCESKRAEQRENNAMITREISKRRVQVEEYAFKIGQSKGLDEQRARLEEDDRVLRAKKKECDELTQEKARVKERITKKEELETRRRIELEEIDKKIDEFKRREDMVYKITNVRQKLEITESTLQQLKGQNDLKRAEEENQLKVLEDMKKEVVHQFSEEMKHLQQEIKSVMEEKLELKRKTDDDDRMTNDTIRIAKQAIEEFERRLGKTREEADRDIKSVLQDYKVNSGNSLLGIHDKSIQENGSKNRTFIKSRDD